MLKTVTAFIAALIAGWVLIGSATEASAHYSHYGHSGCCGGPIPPTYVYHTVHKVSHVTRYRDESRTNYVYRTHRIVHVLRVRPIVYVHTVTRIHHHTVGIARPVYVHETQYLPAEHISSGQVINTYDCRCSYRHCK